jgi:hypothetical protein
MERNRFSRSQARSQPLALIQCSSRASDQPMTSAPALDPVVRGELEVGHGRGHGLLFPELAQILVVGEFVEGLHAGNSSGVELTEGRGALRKRSRARRAREPSAAPPTRAKPARTMKSAAVACQKAARSAEVVPPVTEALRSLNWAFERFVGDFAGGFLLAEGQPGFAFAATGGADQDCPGEQGDEDSFEVVFHGWVWGWLVDGWILVRDKRKKAGRLAGSRPAFGVFDVGLLGWLLQGLFTCRSVSGRGGGGRTTRSAGLGREPRPRARCLRGSRR